MSIGKILRSLTPGSIPANGSLLEGQLVVNIPDGLMWIGDFSGNPVEVSGGGSGGSDIPSSDLLNMITIGTDDLLYVGDVPIDDKAYIRKDSNWAEIAWGDIPDAPTEFPPSIHTHTESEITDLDKYTQLEVDTAIAVPQLAIDDHLIDLANPHVVTWPLLVDKPAEFPPEVHNHTKSDITDFAHTHELSDLPAEFPPEAHEHTEADIIDLDKYTQAEIDSVVNNLYIALSEHITDDTVHFADAPNNGNSYVRESLNWQELNVFDGAGFNGLVPDPVTQQGDLLSDDGTWVPLPSPPLSGISPSYYFKAGVIVDVNPGIGYFSFNFSDWASVTEIYINNLTVSENQAENWLQSIRRRDAIGFWDNDTEKTVYFILTGEVFDRGVYQRIPVEFWVATTPSGNLDHENLITAIHVHNPDKYLPLDGNPNELLAKVSTDDYDVEWRALPATFPPDPHLHAHADTTGQTTDDHHPQLHDLDSHTDVAVTAVADNDLLTWDSGASAWVNLPPESLPHFKVWGTKSWFEISPPIEIDPLDLFTSGENGGYYDISDISTLWLDTAGTLPVTTDGQEVARIDDKSGNGNHMLNGANGTNTTPMLYKTNGSEHWLECSDTQSSTSMRYLAVVGAMNMEIPSVVGQSVEFNSTGGSTTFRGAGIYGNPASTNYLIPAFRGDLARSTIYTRGADVGVASTTTNGITNDLTMDAPHALVGQWSNLQHELRIDGSVSPSGVTPWSTEINNEGRPGIASFGPIGTRLYAMVIVDRALEEGELLGLEVWLTLRGGA
ncbi:MAG: hypothetical protein DRQ54_04995 [Gammaproteobacteria bacterium]|nr:MAG: hypothetical protein DRQ54_04995 [Gammaproteobacteria bacterium]